MKLTHIVDLPSPSLALFSSVTQTAAGILFSTPSPEVAPGTLQLSISSPSRRNRPENLPPQALSLFTLPARLPGVHFKITDGACQWRSKKVQGRVMVQSRVTAPQYPSPSCNSVIGT
jgi:hypothetical protein